MCVATFTVRDDVLEIKFGFDGPTKLRWEGTEVVTNPKNRLVSFCVSQEYFMRSCSVSSGPCRSHRGNMEAEAMVLQVDLVSMVTSDGHRQWQQWEGRSLSMRHYNNKGNLVMLGCWIARLHCRLCTVDDCRGSPKTHSQEPFQRAWRLGSCPGL